jgi:hypothetical protein
MADDLHPGQRGSVAIRGSRDRGGGTLFLNPISRGGEGEDEEKQMSVNKVILIGNLGKGPRRPAKARSPPFPFSPDVRSAII